MKFRNQWSWIVASLGIFCLLVVGVTLPGCSGSDDSTSTDAADPGESADPGATTDPAEPSDPEPTTDPVEPSDPDATTEPDEPAEPSDPATPEDTTAEPAAAASGVPDISTFAPAKYLTAEVAEYIEDLEGAVETEEDYNDTPDKVARLASTLAVMAVGLGLHDEDNPYKASAGALMKAAQDLAVTTDFASAQAGVAAVKAAAASQEPSDVELKWGKIAALAPLMKQVPLINSKLGRSVKRLDRSADDAQSYSAVIALIAQGTVNNSDETIAPERVEDWIELCIAARDGAAAVGAAARAGDAEAAAAAMQKLDETCTACHEIFNPEEE